MSEFAHHCRRGATVLFGLVFFGVGVAGLMRHVSGGGAVYLTLLGTLVMACGVWPRPMTTRPQGPRP